MVVDLDDGYIDMMGAELATKKNEEDEEVKYYIEDILDSDHYEVKTGTSSDSDDKKDIDGIAPYTTDEENLWPGESKELDANEYFKRRLMGDPDPVDPQWDGPEVERNKRQVRITLDSRAHGNKPYFRLSDIRGKDLFFAGDENLFIKSSNYLKSPEFYFGDGLKDPNNTDAKEAEGYGMKIDLYQGFIDAYNLRVNSRTFYVDSRKNATANFVVKEPWFGNNLIYMGTPDCDETIKQ
jgi:hypothetical protein